MLKEEKANIKANVQNIITTMIIDKLTINIKEGTSIIKDKKVLKAVRETDLLEDLIAR